MSVSRPDPPYLEFWYEALSSDFGLILSTNDPESLRQRLYKARRESGDSALSSMSLRISPTLPHSELWIVKDKK